MMKGLIVTTCLVVMAGVVVSTLYITGVLGGPETDSELDRAREVYSDKAELVCSLQFNTYSDAYKNCVRQETQNKIDKWEYDGRPAL